MPGFNYAGTLRPHRVTPDRGLTLPESILRPDYFFDGTHAPGPEPQP